MKKARVTVEVGDKSQTVAWEFEDGHEREAAQMAMTFLNEDNCLADAVKEDMLAPPHSQ